jgi:iron(II)-dependent oxidoreductase
MISSMQLAEWVKDARRHTLELIADLSDEQLLGPHLSITNPLLWEIGHVAWFQEKWVLRHAAGRKPIRADGDRLYDSAAVPHDNRWDLHLPSRKETLTYMMAVADEVLDRLDSPTLTTESVYFVLLSVFHEDMHTEAFTYTRQTLEYPPPRFLGPSVEAQLGGPLAGDAFVPGGTFQLGATVEEPFVFDNEKWAHAVEVAPFALARAPVTQEEFAAFVEDDGYRRQELWTPAGWRWRTESRAEHPAYWRRETPGWWRRDFDRWLPLEPYRPIVHVNWHEAQAYCRWARRRLPTEIEWEVAAAAEPDSSKGRLATAKRRFAWGDSVPTAERACLDWRHRGCANVASFPAGDSAFGCRQMIGNVWEWTDSTFGPYPGFVVDPYKEYSAPWFGTHKVLRGGAWTTRARLLRNSWRNFYTPERRDVWAGFRTCAVL